MIKRLHLYMLRSFLPLLAMTFFICLFIVLMQFLWRYVNDMVGKGLSFDVLAELFFYAALTMTPMALPLAILLASLMTFGNLGENFELTAMKASGVSLINIMKPLIVVITFISIGAFFFQNDVLPVAQTKMWTLLYSMRQKSPELEIPEGVFYDQIPGFNLYVDHKNRETGTLYDVIIYDMSSGFDNARVILADSGKLVSAADRVHLYLTLWQGEQFENLSDRQAATSAGSTPYRRESFDFKEILLTFDASFNRMDEDGIRNQYVGKNMAELLHTIDSVDHRIDSVGVINSSELRAATFVGVSNVVLETENHPDDGSSANAPSQVVPRAGDHPELRQVAMDQPLNIDSIFHASTSGRALAYLNQAINRARRSQSEYQFKALPIDDNRRIIRLHAMELHKKFTLSFACLIFFFIGAPLGAIIRKGGLGMPLVISVLLFIFYYIINNTGLKMARDGKLDVWEGVWLSSAVLLPMGIFLTYKAMHDSAVFNKDAYLSFFRSLVGLREKRNIARKEVRINDIEPREAVVRLKSIATQAGDMSASIAAHRSYTDYWRGLTVVPSAFATLRADTEATVEYLSDTSRKEVIAHLNRLPVIAWRLIYNPSMGRRALSLTGIILFPIGLPVYLIALFDLRRLDAELRRITSEATALSDYISSLQTQTNDNNSPT